MNMLPSQPSSFPLTEGKFLLLGQAGDLEVFSKNADEKIARGIGVFCHPNPEQGGNFDNKVVTTVCKAFNHHNLHSLRFNFRGVGLSEGSFGNVVGEIADLKTVLEWIRHVLPQLPIYLGGVSFGAYITAKATFEWSDSFPIKQLISVAPTVDRRDYTPFTSMNCPWIIIQGEEDEVVSSQAVYQWYDSLIKTIQHEQNQNTIILPKLIKIPNAGHFFNGQLPALRQAVENHLI
jgi:alpha/beta superfamily hydrolase